MKTTFRTVSSEKHVFATASVTRGPAGYHPVPDPVRASRSPVARGRFELIVLPAQRVVLQRVRALSDLYRLHDRVIASVIFKYSDPFKPGRWAAALLPGVSVGAPVPHMARQSPYACEAGRLEDTFGRGGAAAYLAVHHDLVFFEGG